MFLTQMAVLILSLMVVGCGGGAGSSNANTTNDTLGVDSTDLVGGFPALIDPPANNLQMSSCSQPAHINPGSTITGVVEYERIPIGFSGLTYNERVNLPARGVVVQAVDASNGQCSETVVATALTNAKGKYGLNVPVNQSVCVQVRAQLYRTASMGGGHWDMQITDNTNGNAAYYLVDNIMATPAENSVRHFFAASGALVGSSDYTQVRAAAPFAILDTLCESIETLVAVDHQVFLPQLQVHWSVNNIASSGNPDEGEVGGAFFRQRRTTDQFNTTLSVTNEIFLLGDDDNNTDEYDPHVISHEFGHFIVNNLSRTDAFGGDHALGDHLDMRVAFDEGLADAYSAIALMSAPISVLSKPEIYRDTLGNNQGFGFSFNLANNTTVTSGWYSEPSVYSIIYNLFDAANDAVDQVTLGFGPIYTVLTSTAYQHSDAFITIFSFINQLKKNVVDIQAIDALLAAEDFESINDDFGSGEDVSNNDISGIADSEAIYTPLPNSSTQAVCSNDRFGVHNKLAVRQYLTFDADVSRLYRFVISPVSQAFAGGQALFQIYQQGKLVSQTQADSAGKNLSVELTMKGRYVLSLAETVNTDSESVGAGRRCFAVTVE